MANDLIISKTDLVSLIEEKGIMKLIEPLVKEIFLFHTHVAGTTYIEPQDIFEKLVRGQKLILRREADNHFDSLAILVLTEDLTKIGYIPKVDNAIFSRLLDAGKLLTAKVDKVDLRGDYSLVSISIYLVDF